MATHKLPAEVAEKYRLVNWKGGARQAFGKFGVVDLTKITIRQADSLVARGFKKLVKKEPPAKEPEDKEPRKGSRKS